MMGFCAKSLASAVVAALMLSGGQVACAAGQQGGSGHTFAVSGKQFVLDGKPFQIISGEMHSPRIPREYWRARLKMAKAMGLNAITTYVFWNVHEATPGVYDFAGQNDVAEFVREAQQEGLYVLLRPGPYVCAEWEFGGYPAWLLKDKGTVVRSSDPRFMEPATKWLHRLGQELAPLLLANGGPIIAVQVENEYGSFGDVKAVPADRAYMEQIKQALIDGGFDKSLLYTADGAEEVPKGNLPELPAVINFGTGDAKDAFALLAKERPDGPEMTGEYWAGWFDHWGEKHQATDGAKQAAELGWMLKQGYSVSLYMFHGGTSFGWMNGANWSDGNYQPDVTSYDYDATLDESGRPTAKYAVFRDVIQRAGAARGVPQAVGLGGPAVPGTQAVAPFALGESASLWDNLPEPVVSRELKTMEDLGQAYGYILYRTVAPADLSGSLVVDGLHDYGLAYVDGKLIGSMDRRHKENMLPMTLAKGQTLDLLVENSGRINYSMEIRGERKGILGSVSVAGTKLEDWKIYALPMADLLGLKFKAGRCSAAPCFYRGNLMATAAGNAGADTFLDTKGLSKGFVWVDGRALGRTWEIGPQRTLYLPGVWLKVGKNEVVVVDLGLMDPPTLRGLAKPILDGPVSKED